MRSVTVEPKLGIEPSASILPRSRSTDELQGQVTSAASGIRYPHRFALKGGWTACRTAASVSSELIPVPGIYHIPCVERGFGVPRSHRSWLPIALSRLVRAHASRLRAVGEGTSDSTVVLGARLSELSPRRGRGIPVTALAP